MFLYFIQAKLPKRSSPAQTQANSFVPQEGTENGSSGNFFVIMKLSSLKINYIQYCFFGKTIKKIIIQNKILW